MKYNFTIFNTITNHSFILKWLSTKRTTVYFFITVITYKMLWSHDFSFLNIHIIYPQIIIIMILKTYIKAINTNILLKLIISFIFTSPFWLR